MILLENYPCKLFYQLQMRANEYVRIHNPIVNQIKEHHNNFKRITGIRKQRYNVLVVSTIYNFTRIFGNVLGHKEGK